MLLPRSGIIDNKEEEEEEEEEEEGVSPQMFFCQKRSEIGQRWEEIAIQAFVSTEIDLIPYQTNSHWQGQFSS